MNETSNVSIPTKILIKTIFLHFRLDMGWQRPQNRQRRLDWLCKYQNFNLWRHQKIWPLRGIIQSTNESMGIKICLQAAKVFGQQKYQSHFSAHVFGCLARIPQWILHHIFHGICYNSFWKAGESLEEIDFPYVF